MTLLQLMDADTEALVREVALDEPPGIHRFLEVMALLDGDRQAGRVRLVGIDNLSSDTPVAWVRRQGGAE